MRTERLLSGNRLITVLCVLLGGATIALYSPVFGHSFVVLDDHDYVVANAHVHGGLSWSTIKWAFTSTEAANWHPLTWLSHALDYQLFALNPAGHHFDSVLIHAVNAVLLFLLLVWATKRVGPSLLVAALFAVHPLNVESVAWIAERKNVLSTFFFLLAIGAYGWYARRPDWRRYLLVAALFAAGLMAKPMVITLPFVLLLLDYWPLERIVFRSSPSAVRPNAGAETSAEKRTATNQLQSLLLEKVPLLLLSAASAWLTLKAQRVAERTFQELPFGIRIENAVVAYGAYLWKAIWPARLAFYPHAVAALPAWQWILSALVLISVTALVVIFRSREYLPVGWFWFLGTLVPVIGLVQVGEYAMADRYAYVPLIGIFVMIAWSLADWARARKIRTVWLMIPAVCVLTALSSVTYRQTSYWESDYQLWLHTLEGAESPLAHNALAMALMHPDSELTRHDLEDLGTEQNRMDEARSHFERALELRQQLAQQNPHAYPYMADMARTLNNLGNLDRLQNRMDEARRHNEAALEIYRQLAAQNPDVYLQYLAATLNNLGSVDRQQGRMEEARQHYEEGLKIDRQLAEQDPAKYLPNIAMTLNEYGFLAATQNRMEEARQHYEEALKIDQQLAEQSPAAYLPDLAMTLTDFARLDAIQNQMDEARQHYEEALKIERQLAQQDPAVYLPDLAMTLSNLGRVDRVQSRMEEARQNDEEALKIRRQLAQENPQYLPALAMALNDLAFVESQQNRIEPARAHYEEALSLLRSLAQSDNRYGGDVARVEASLQQLNQKSKSR
ncbi:MAG: tetratricopeptide repeat protein [Candidatus Korobacteraceae bacterium]